MPDLDDIRIEATADVRWPDEQPAQPEEETEDEEPREEHEE